MREGEAMKDYFIHFLAALFAMLFIALFLLSFSVSDQSIVIDEPFEVTSDTSKYSCVISEVDKDLSLDCLRVK